MIVICNGAFKSGSSWLLNIVRRLASPQQIDERWRNPKWNNPSIDPEKLRGFIEEFRDSTDIYVSKNHLGDPASKRLLTEEFSDCVRVLNITRDIRDVVVSAYYHYRRVGGAEEEFNSFFKSRGVKVAKKVCKYNSLWSGNVPNLHVASYERLHVDGLNEIRAIGEFIGIGVAPTKIESVYEATRFDTWKARTQSSHLRKGVIGDWKNHLGEEDVDCLRRELPEWAFSPLAD